MFSTLHWICSAFPSSSFFAALLLMCSLFFPQHPFVFTGQDMSPAIYFLHCVHWHACLINSNHLIPHASTDRTPLGNEINPLAGTQWALFFFLFFFSFPQFGTSGFRPRQAKCCLRQHIYKIMRNFESVFKHWHCLAVVCSVPISRGQKKVADQGGRPQYFSIPVQLTVWRQDILQHKRFRLIC